MALYNQIHADLENGTTTAPTFRDAADHYRILKAIHASSFEGKRIHLDDFNPADG